MSNSINITEKAKRMQTLMAMETLIKSLGGRKAYITWLAALPENTELGLSGGIGHSAAMAIAENEEQYSTMVSAFAGSMAPVLGELVTA